MDRSPHGVQHIHHVLSGGCEGIGRNKNYRYRMEMNRVLGKCRNSMSEVNNNEGAEQADSALRALEKPRRQMDPRTKQQEELALRQMISGIIPEWQGTDDKKKKGAIAVIKLWTGETMNYARIPMKTWIAIKNEHKAKVQSRWDNREKTRKAFQTWRRRVGHEYETQTGAKEDRRGKRKRRNVWN
eukprot:5429144-Pleurochrysis_carterae.AAC.1